MTTCIVSIAAAALAGVTMTAAGVAMAVGAALLLPLLLAHSTRLRHHERATGMMMWLRTMYLSATVVE